jgi:hypothetical protein
MLGTCDEFPMCKCAASRCLINHACARCGLTIAVIMSCDQYACVHSDQMRDQLVTIFCMVLWYGDTVGVTAPRLHECPIWRRHANRIVATCQLCYISCWSSTTAHILPHAMHAHSLLSCCRCLQYSMYAQQWLQRGISEASQQMLGFHALRHTTGS